MLPRIAVNVKFLVVDSNIVAFFENVLFAKSVNLRTFIINLSAV